MSDEPAPLFVVKGVQVAPDEDGDMQPVEDAPPRYWTGGMNGSWPEYLRDRGRAHRCRKAEAQLTASQFNSRTENYKWSAEPA